MIAIELEFGIEFDQSEIQNFANVGELMASIEKNSPPKDEPTLADFLIKPTLSERN